MFKKYIFFISNAESDSIIMIQLRNKSQTKILLRLHFSNNSTTQKNVKKEWHNWIMAISGRPRTLSNVRVHTKGMPSKQSSPLKAFVASIVRDNSAEPRVLKKLRHFFTLKILSHRYSYRWLERTQSSPKLALSHWLRVMTQNLQCEKVS